MEEDPAAPESEIGRSRRNRVQTRVYDQQPSKTSRKAKRNRPTKVPSAGKANQSLIDVIKYNGKVIPQKVKTWVEQYEKDAKSAMVELLTMLFETCGAKFPIREDFLDKINVDDLAVTLDKFAKKGYIEGTSKKEFKNFKQNIVLFWDNLVVESQNGPLFDQVLFDKCIDCIIALSRMPSGVFGLVATLMGLQLVTSFITVAKVLGAQQETTQRQLNAEKKKRAEGPRVESLDKRLSTTHEKIKIINEMMRKIFTGCRDIDPEIRMLCIQSLGVWILSYPSLFLQDEYLKYLGWTLNDKSAGVRKATVVALQNLYEVDDNVPSLFTKKFYKWMLDLAGDIDTSVAMCAIGLVKQLLRHQLVPNDELGSLYDLLIDESAEIRCAIGALAYDHLIAQKFSSSQSHSSGDDGSTSEDHLARILQILRYSTDHIHSITIIDDVWEYMDAMKDWKCIISMLLEDNSSYELTDNDETNLTRLLCASVRKAVGATTDYLKQNFTKAQRETIENNRRDITVSMMKNYPRLLRKFLVDKAKIPSLVDIIMYMDLELYSLNRQEQNFRAVLQLIKEAFFRHADKDALRSCVKAMNYCSTEAQGELQDFAKNIFKDLEADLTVKLKSAIKKVVDGDDECSLLVNLKRLYELQLKRVVPLESLYEDFAMILQTFRNLEDEVLGFLLLDMYMHVARCLQSVLISVDFSKAAVSSLLSKRNVLFKQLEQFFQIVTQEDGKSRNLLACKVLNILSESWCLFKSTSFVSTKLESLGYSPDDSSVRKFWKLCERQLYISDEIEDEDVNKDYTEETNPDAIMIAAAKLVATDTVPKEYLGAEIISHFVMHGTSVAEVVKYLIDVLKKKDEDVSNFFSKAMKQAYGRHLVVRSSSNDESLSLKSFQECKDLSARLSGIFSQNKNRADILKIVKDGIEFAFLDAPKHMSFLDCAIQNFVSKLPVPDIRDILKDAEKRRENVNTDEDPSGWRPYYIFRDKYMETEDEKVGTAVKRRGCPRKMEGKKLFGEHSSSEEDEGVISGSDQEAPDDEEKQEDEEDDEAPFDTFT